MFVSPPQKFSRNDKFLRDMWSSYPRMSFRFHRDQLDEENDVVGIIDNELKEHENDTRYNTSAKIMAIYKKLPRRSSDTDPDRTFIMNRARAYYAGYLKD
ncbi:hypothetical protein BPOR_0542g00010 [Botrytis porri]|uniref:Uncharacterized protein n=1 Tax=Botrytis porri TaxID=87229 RepID=A0A4Z1KDD6_9HELO|nr:hypothetical protein BPOR_0542g00010 [Botrytis porri]